MKGHYIAAACEEMGIDTPDSTTSDSEMLIQLQQKPQAQQRSYIHSIAQAVVNKFSIIDGSVLFHTVEESGDMVHNYARSLCVVRCLPGAPCVVRCLPNTLLTCQDVPGSHSAFLCRVKGHTQYVVRAEEGEPGNEATTGTIFLYNWRAGASQPSRTTGAIYPGPGPAMHTVMFSVSLNKRNRA